MRPTTKPARAIAATPANRPQVCACSALSTGSIASLSTSQNRKSRIPVAVAVKKALTCGDEAAHPAHRQADEDRQAGDRAEQQGLSGAYIL